MRRFQEFCCDNNTITLACAVQGYVHRMDPVDAISLAHTCKILGQGRRITADLNATGYHGSQNDLQIISKRDDHNGNKGSIIEISFIISQQESNSFRSKVAFPARGYLYSFQNP